MMISKEKFLIFWNQNDLDVVFSNMFQHFKNVERMSIKLYKKKNNSPECEGAYEFGVEIYDLNHHRRLYVHEQEYVEAFVAAFNLSIESLSS